MTTKADLTREFLRLRMLIEEAERRVAGNSDDTRAAIWLDALNQRRVRLEQAMEDMGR